MSMKVRVLGVTILILLGVAVAVLWSSSPKLGSPENSSDLSPKKHQLSGSALIESKPRDPEPHVSKPVEAKEQDWAESDPEPADMGPEDQGIDLGADLESISEWTDPVNQRVLGSAKWMAQPTPTMEKEINEAFEKHAKSSDPRISRLDRKSAIEAARPLVDDCYEEAKVRLPGLKGRVIVIFEASSTGAQGIISDVRVSSIVKLDKDLEFSPCVLNALEGLRFPVEGPGEPMTVEYPFFYDSNR